VPVEPRTARIARIDCSLLRFILRRAALIVPTFLGVTILAFALIHLIPGDPVENLSGERGMDPARTWMIGNSPKSDINPALAAGLRADSKRSMLARTPSIFCLPSMRLCRRI